MENGPFTDDFPHKASMYNGFSIAMLNYQKVPYQNLRVFQGDETSNSWDSDDAVDPSRRGSCDCQRDRLPKG
jgi:hypothetical protein